MQRSMAASYKLRRGGQLIEIEKEQQYFTAILPQGKMVEEVTGIDQVEECKKVFHNVYKIRTSQDVRDDVMKHIREGMNSAGISHHAYHPIGDSVTRYYLTDMIMVEFGPKTSNSTVETIMNYHGLEYVKGYGDVEDVRTFLFRVTRSAGKNPIKVCNDLNERKEVIWSEPNLINRFQTSYEPTDDLFSRQWHLKSRDSIEVIAEADVSAPDAWELTRGKKEVVVAVVDDGFDINHPDFVGKVVFPKDFVDGDLHPFPTSAHGDFHGTPCAGVAIGAENGEGIVGIAPGCSFMPVRFDLAADDNLLWEIFDYVGKRADVISNSWGPVPVFAPLSTLLKNKFTELATSGGPRGKGCVICFAAGNFNAPLNDPNNKKFEWRHPNYGILESKRSILNGNATHPDVIAVSASNSLNRKSAYSNWGKEISVAAPSDNWHPVDPQQRMPGRGIWTTDNEEVGLGFSTNSRYTGFFGGTSSATPLVAGVAALVISANPELTAREVRRILEQTADKIEDKEPDPVLGNKKGTYDSRGHSEWFGFGKVNAAKAVKRALELAGTGEEELNVPSTGIYIVAAVANPTGADTKRETVSLLNARNEPVQLNGWKLIDNFGREQALGETELNPGAFITIVCDVIRLSNRGGMIQLVNPKGEMVSKVQYTQSQASQSGWTIKF
jgi:subtilisin family serine protease